MDEHPGFIACVLSGSRRGILQSPVARIPLPRRAQSAVKIELHGSWDAARQKHFGLLLHKKVSGCLRVHRHRAQTVRVYVDPLHSSYSKAVEVVDNITKAVIRRSHPNVTMEGVYERDSKQTPTIQLCDLLLGAVMSEWAREPATGPKQHLREFIAAHLGWDNLHADTNPPERKFNIWMFHDPTRAKRDVQTRPVKLKYQLPVRPSG
jgi:hypothetical protein